MTSRLEGVIILLCLVLSLTAILYMGTGGGEGPMGPPGIQGVMGGQGLTGPAGSTGPQGSSGSDGGPGSQGIQGIQGIQGPTGLASLGVGDSAPQLYTEDFEVPWNRLVTLYGVGFPKDPVLYFKDSKGATTHIHKDTGVTTTKVTSIGSFEIEVTIRTDSAKGLGYFFARVDGTSKVTYATWPVWIK